MLSLQYKLFSPLISKLSLKWKIKILYFKRFFKFPDLLTPVTFNEKIQRKKLYDRSNTLTIVADKLESKNFVLEKKLDIYIPKVLWVGEIENLDLDHLPNKFVVKANHASKTNLIVTDKLTVTIEKLLKLRSFWFSINQYDTMGEWAYKDINKKIFIEEYLEFNGEVPDDYKFFVFHGKVKFIQYDSGRFTKHYRNMFDENWNDLGIAYSYPYQVPSPDKPIFLQEMINISEKLGKNFDFIRVDLYFYNNMITFGELTVYPGAGYEKFPDIKWDIEFGKYWEQNY